MTIHYQRFAIYSKDKAISFPLVEFSMKRDEIIAGVKAGTFPIEEISKLFRNATEAVMAAIQEGKK